VVCLFRIISYTSSILEYLSSHSSFLTKPRQIKKNEGSINDKATYHGTFLALGEFRSGVERSSNLCNHLGFVRLQWIKSWAKPDLILGSTDFDNFLNIQWKNGVNNKSFIIKIQ
jgi:hypothetical protein